MVVLRRPICWTIDHWKFPRQIEQARQWLNWCRKRFNGLHLDLQGTINRQVHRLVGNQSLAIKMDSKRHNLLLTYCDSEWMPREESGAFRDQIASVSQTQRTPPSQRTRLAAHDTLPCDY